MFFWRFVRRTRKFPFLIHLYTGGLGWSSGFLWLLTFARFYSLSRSQAAAALREYLRKRGEEPISLEPLSRAEGETNTDAIVRTSKALYVMELKSTAHVCVDF